MPKIKSNKESIKPVEKKDDKTIKIRCPMCGQKKAISMYYKSNSPLYANNYERSVFCKQCVWNTYDTYYNILKDIKNSVYITCMKFDVPFNENDYNGMKKQLVNDNSAHPMKIYMKNINSLGSINNGLTGFDPKFLFEKGSNENEIANSLTQEVKDLEYNIQLSEPDKQVKNDVIKLIGYDPFSGYSNFDQKFLYNELIPYLTEDTLEDAYLLSQVIQIVNNNNQIRKIDLVIASLSNDTKSLISNQGEIKNLTTTKKSIVESSDKIAKENSISVKNRGDKKAGKSTLTYMMKNLREIGFEDAEHDYYDHMKAIGMKHTADISNKSILEQLQFDENDYISMVKEQREIMQRLQSKLDDIEEENRQLHVRLNNNIN